MLIALYERVTGLYASLVGINAYHQPGVEAGKKAAGAVLTLQRALVAALTAERGRAFTAPELAAKAGAPEAAEIAFKVLEHLSANPATGVRRRAGATATAAKYRLA